MTVILPRQRYGLGLQNHTFGLAIPMLLQGETIRPIFQEENVKILDTIYFVGRYAHGWHTSSVILHPKIVTMMRKGIMKRKKRAGSNKVWMRKHGFPKLEIWNTNNTIARLVVPRLKAFRDLNKHGYPPALASMEAWDAVLDKMIDAFKLYADTLEPEPEQEEDFEKGLRQFCKYYCYLWD